MRKTTVWLLCLVLLLTCALPLSHAAELPDRKDRALLVGVDDFVTKPSAYPSSTNNVYAMQELFQRAAAPLETILVPAEPITSAQQLTQLIQTTFADAQEGDVSYLYISTHGLYDPANGIEPQLLLSDGIVEGSITPAQLEAAFAGIQGTKVIILDACYSGAFIGKGLAEQPKQLYFQGDDFKVLTSSGAMEESWYWSSEDGEIRQGAFYFTQALTQALSPVFDYPADQNRDGSITLYELHQHLLLVNATSTPQVYPQKDDLILFRYDPSAAQNPTSQRAAITDVTFSGNTLSRSNPEITIEFIARRPVQIGYQIVYQREGKWQFDQAQIIYDEAERFTVFGDKAGAISPGRKVRTLTMGELPQDAYGYVMVQLISIENGKPTVHAGRVLCVLPEEAAPAVSISVADSFTPSTGRELCIFVSHDAPCTLSISIVDAQGKTLHRLCHKQSTRPMQLVPSGSVFYWDGLLKTGEPLTQGTYQVRVQAHTEEDSVTVFSTPFTIE